jgi:O-antigen ligase
MLGLFTLGIPLDVVLATRFGGSSAVLGVPLALAGAWQLLRTGRLRPLPASLAWLAAFVAWCALSVAWAVDQEAFETRSLTNLQLLAFVWLGWQILRSERDLRVVLAAFVAGALFAAADVWRSMLAGQAYKGGIRYTAQSFNPNDLAVTVAIGVPMALYLALGGSTRARLLAAGYVPVAASAIALSGSRAGAITFVVGAASVFLLSMRGTARAAALAAALLACTVFAARFVPGESWARLLTVREQLASGSIGDRGRIWLAGVDVLQRSPIVGVGTGGFYRSVAPALGRPAVAHNTLLSIAVEQGVVGLALFATAVALLARRALGAARAHRALALSLLATWLVGSASLSWEGRKTTWLVFLVLAALGAARAPPEGRPP